MATNNSGVDIGFSDEPPNDEIDDSEETLTDNNSDSEANAYSCYSLDEDPSNDEIDELEIQQLK